MLRSKTHTDRMAGDSAGGRTAAHPIPSGEELSQLPAAAKNIERGRVVGTLSFPVKKTKPQGDHSNLIAEIVRRRRPGLLLCAGWSISSEENLRPVLGATRRTGTTVVVETRPAPAISFRVENGRRFRMGKQLFAERKETNKSSRALNKLTHSIRERSFCFSGRPVFLLVCGEVMVVEGRGKVHFHRSAPCSLQDAVRAERVLILNPTHTRMGNNGTIQAWRRFLSEKGRVYVSASNWCVSKDKNGRRQKPSPTLHSLWYDGREVTKPIFPPAAVAPLYCNSYCYREWELPQ